VIIFYVGCHKPTITLLLYPALGQAVNGGGVFGDMTEKVNIFNLEK